MIGPYGTSPPSPDLPPPTVDPRWAKEQPGPQWPGGQPGRQWLAGRPGDRWPGPPADRRPTTTVWVAIVLAASLVTGLVGGVTGAWLHDQVTAGGLLDPAGTLPVPAASSTARDPDSVAGVAASILPSVVAVRVEGDQGVSSGSAFVIRSDGYLLTNNHVVAVDGRSEIRVLFQDGSSATARLVGRDASYDLAVIKVRRSGLRAVRLGDSDGVVVGDPVIAIGAPLGLQGTVTTGIVSAVNRPVTAGEAEETAFINAIQTDAAINPGNSGGPLVDGSGAVIGVNSAIARIPGLTSLGAAGSIGLGFAIPSEQARRTADQLIRTGKSQHPVIGVMLDRRYDGEGVKVLEESQDGQPTVTPDGPADRAGIRPGDVIVAFNGRPMTVPDELVVAIRAEEPGSEVTLTVRRDGKDRDYRVRLDEAGE